MPACAGMTVGVAPTSRSYGPLVAEMNEAAGTARC
jgi:hypothetical protein